MSNIVAPTGYVDINNANVNMDSTNLKSRENTIPKEDMSYYFNSYLVPKYGLNNLNVQNVGSFMKDLEMNWSKLNTELKDKVMNILVDGIFSNNYDFKSALLSKLNIKSKESSTFSNIPSNTISSTIPGTGNGKSSFANTSGGGSTSNGTGNNNMMTITLFFIVIIVLVIHFKLI
jgi:hypothetical protein